MTAVSSPGISLAVIVGELRQLRDDRATGTYYVLSDDNRQVRICLVDGEISAIFYRLAEGPGAVIAMMAMCIARTRFSADGLHPTNQKSGALSTDEILEELLRHAGKARASPGNPATRPAGDPQSKPQSNGPEKAKAEGPTVASLSAEERHMIRQALVNYLGPIGNLVYDDYQQSDRTVASMLIKLSTEIPDGQRAADFLALVRKRLSRLG
jgi:hypothetical protein